MQVLCLNISVHITIGICILISYEAYAISTSSYRILVRFIETSHRRKNSTLFFIHAKIFQLIVLASF